MRGGVLLLLAAVIVDGYQHLHVLRGQTQKREKVSAQVERFLANPGKDYLVVPLARVERSKEQQAKFWTLLTEEHARIRRGEPLPARTSPTVSLVQKTQTKVGHKKHLENAEYRVPLLDIDNSQYVGTIKVGEPPQEFRVIFDTGSCLLWIDGDECNSPACTDGQHRKFLPDKSHTFLEGDTEMVVTFGTGEIEGYLAKDTFHFSGLDVKSQGFGVITSETGDVFKEGAFDGILGLSFPEVSGSKESKPVFDTMIDQKLLTTNAFSFYYSLYPTQKSAVVFGPAAKDLFEAPLQLVELSKEFYWEVKLVDIKLGGKSMGVCPGGDCKLVLDTGTSLLTAPTDQLSAIQKQINVNANCDGLGKLPLLTYVIGDDHGQYEVHLEPNYYTNAYDDDNKRACELSFMALDVDSPRGPLFILGDTFLRKYYVYFERGAAGEKSKIGFAVSKQDKFPTGDQTTNDLGF